MNENNSPEIPEEELSREERIQPTMPPVAAGFLGLVVIFLLYQVGGAILTLIIFGFDIQNADINAMRLMTIGGQILLMLLPALLFAKLIYEDVGYIIRFKFPSWKEILVFVLGLILLTPLLQSYLYLQNYLFEMLASHSEVLTAVKSALDSLDEIVNDSYAGLMESHSIFEASFIIIVVAVVPAICEETFFRGFIQKSFEFRLKPIWAISITAICFALYHLNPYGLVALFALAMFFGFAAYKSQSIFVTMILHFLNNLISILAFFIWGEEETMETAIEPSMLSDNLFTFIFFLALFSLYIYLVVKNYHKLKPEEKI